MPTKVTIFLSGTGVTYLPTYPKMGRHYWNFSKMHGEKENHTPSIQKTIFEKCYSDIFDILYYVILSEGGFICTFWYSLSSTSSILE